MTRFVRFKRVMRWYAIRREALELGWSDKWDPYPDGEMHLVFGDIRATHALMYR